MIDPYDTDAINKAVIALKGGLKFYHPGGVTLGGEFKYPTLYEPATIIDQAWGLIEDMKADGSKVELIGVEKCWALNINNYSPNRIMGQIAPRPESAICLAYIEFKKEQSK